ncbi:short-chain dehydrogenase [Halalkalibacillus sediminis]|uniref:Short-chain dehydrogenase n=1 Tax=Halalkalibacillus sediminis TaxID=2018042 RepID=A0A2I0QSK2_9BACI|nr:SDR family oxidoreductase [Halalkalibacillus sediminis]PKR77317.1 short-chain dehydrogenase [Halalkalibacillus sediminis]
MSPTVLITGATSGIGLELVNLFAEDKYDMILVARNEEKLQELEKTYNHVTILPKDLSEPEAAKDVFHFIKDHNLQIDTLVNNAGFGLLGTFDELPIEEQSRMIQLNINALTELTYYFLPEMKKRNHGKIMNVASTAAFQPGPLMAVYYASKSYVLSFSEALNVELEDTNLSLTTLCPGPTQTKFGDVAGVSNTKMFDSAMPASIVAQKGYEAMQKGKGVVITGRMNSFGAIGAKFLPRRTAARIAKRIAQEK